MIELTRTATSVQWNGKSVEITPKDQCVASSVDKAVYVVTPLSNSFKVVSYGLDGKAQGEYEYKNKTLIRVFSRSKKGSIVYCDNEKNGKKTWYQADLMPNGYCTDVHALHRTGADGKIIPFVEDGELSDEKASTAVEVVEKKPSVDDIVNDLDKPKTPLSLEKNKSEDAEDDNENA